MKYLIMGIIMLGINYQAFSSEEYGDDSCYSNSKTVSQSIKEKSQLIEIIDEKLSISGTGGTVGEVCANVKLAYKVSGAVAECVEDKK